MRWRTAVAAVTALVLGASTAPTEAAASGETFGSPLDWRMGGHDYLNTKSNPLEWRIRPGNADRLAVKWTFTAAGDTSAIPTVVGGAVYVPDWGGSFSKLDAATGRVIWQRKVSDWNGIPGSIVRASPAYSGGRLYFGDQNGPRGGVGAHLMAVDAATGDLIWKTTLDEHFAAVLTGSPVIFDGVVYQGVSSKEAAVAGLPGYPCCTFRGSVNAVDASTGRVLWKTYTVPDNGGKPGGFSGGGVWGTSPVIDIVHRTVIVGAGQNLTVPLSVTQCQTAGGTPEQCLPDDNHIDQLLALDLRTGAIKWTAGDKEFDAWTVACEPGFPPENCPPNHGGDFDFGEGGHLFTIPGANGLPRLVVGAGQKSGEYWLLDAGTGDTVWKTQVGPGGVHGGIEWGSATDGRRIYVSNANTNHVAHTLPDGTVTTNGIFFALDAVTGRILWERADPSNAETMGAVTTANGVMFAGSMSGHMYAIDGATGRILWDFLGEGSSNAGPAIVNGTLYWGNGYNNRFIQGKGSRTFYAFSVDAR
ncbi:PQQ-binding-like beta-propeller repeat protein [Planotetraspora sp. A-T 1434]|uniref:outer membrane protein assembly factor BamB family protein n=1 Tax=Planotetraspora sp. A-T 1434 TaxID=2979219 RepID=UPI0021BE99EF|nr:PQQ-binding-like beta-propeller repeat protein [Planotetraspora sp. A-T 1434]MCT9930513.1 PQQ-binding-like beta-propeller repeat protein [Planotetraspora sp. A-T 1434]